MKISFYLNGSRVSSEANALRPLLDLLRDDLGHLDTKSGCRRGECGACHVLIDGEIVSACLIPAFRVEGRKVTTISGLGKDRLFGDIQKALEKKRIILKGYSISGLLLSVYDLLNRVRHPTEKDIRDCLSGVPCYHGGIQILLDAISELAQRRRGR